MAIWQFKLEVIPATVIGARDIIPEKEWEDCRWWLESDVPCEMVSDLAGILPPHQAWSEDLRQWGRQDSDLVEIWREGDLVESISARVDTREVDPSFVKRLLMIAEKWQCRLVYSRYRSVLPTEYTAFMEALKESPNFKVVGAPEVWLPKMAEEVANETKSANNSFKVDP